MPVRVRVHSAVSDWRATIRSAYESDRAAAAPWWLFLLLWIGFAGSLALIPATSKLFTHWGGDGSGALPWAWLIPALGSLVSLMVLTAKRNSVKLAAEYERK